MKPFCEEHTLVMHRVKETEEMLREHEKEIEGMKIEIAIIKVKWGLIVTVASLIGSAIASLLVKLLS